MSKQALAVAAVGTAVMLSGITGCAIQQVFKPTAAESSLAQIKMAGYQKIGEYDDSTAGNNTDSSAAYIGPVVPNARLARLVTGAGVEVHVFPSPKPGASINTSWVAGGKAPNGCKLQVERYLPSESPSSWWHVSGAQLLRLRASRLEVFEVTSVCGSG